MRNTHLYTFAVIACLCGNSLAADLAATVSALPERSGDEKLKKAMLTWALDDAKAEESAGRAEFANRVRADVQKALSSAIGKRGQAPANLFPPIAEPSTNPYAVEAIKRVRKLTATKETYAKGPAGAIVKDDRGWHFPTITGEALALCRALCHPDSPMVGDPAIVAPMLRRFAHIYEYLTPGSKHLVDFGDSAELAEMYLLLRTVYPDLILPTYKAAWEKGITVNTEAIADKYGMVFLEAKPGTAYPNGQVRYVNALLFASLIFDRADVRAMADGGMKLLDSALYPDGGFCYIGLQNEVLTYHGINVLQVARYAQVAGDARAKAMVAKTRWYYPLSVEPPGVVEYSTAASWKPYWNQINGGAEAYIVAGATGDAQNLRIAQANFASPDLIYGTFYRPGLKPAPAPDNYVVYDRNTEGPRGRFGTFSFSSTSRDYGDDDRGKSTFVGCMLLNSNEPKPDKWPLNAALQDAACEVRIKPGDGGLDRSKTHLWLAQNETNAATASERFGVVSTRYQLSAYKTKAFDWAGRQVWLLTPERLIGLVEIESLKDQKALGIDGVLKFVSGRERWGVRKEFSAVSDKSAQYGKLITTLHAHDFAKLQTEYTDTFTGDAKKSGRLLLMDAAQAAGTEADYPRGQKHFYLAEVRPDASTAAGQVRRLDVGAALLGFAIDEGSHHYCVVYNPTARAASITLPVDWSKGQVYVHASGETYRPAWISENGQPQRTNPAKATDVRDGRVSLTIPADAHVTVSDLR